MYFTLENTNNYTIIRELIKKIEKKYNDFNK